MPGGSLSLVGLQAPLILTFAIPENAGAVDSAIFCAEDYYELVEAREVHITAGSDAGAVTLDVVKAASGTAIGSGTSMLSSTFNLKSTAATPVSKTSASGLSTTYSSRLLSPGDTVYANFTGTLTAYVGGCLTLTFARQRRKKQVR